MPYRIPHCSLLSSFKFPMSLVLISQVPAFPPSHFELTVPHFGRKFQWWLVDTPDTSRRLRAAYATQNSTPQPTKLLQISQLPACLLSRFKLTVPHFGRKFQQWLVDILDTTLRLRAVYASQNSMPQPTKLLQISYLPTFSSLYHIPAENFNGGWLTHQTQL
jgi:hypothetical protein